MENFVTVDTQQLQIWEGAALLDLKLKHNLSLT
jgi:hypothetical protein